MRAQPTRRGWICRTLRDLTTINYGKSPKEVLSVDGSYPVVGTGGTERYGDGFLYDGDSIILGRKGTIDRVHFVTGRFWTIDTAYFLSDFNGAQPRWLFYFLQNLDLAQLNEATGVPSLSRDLLYKIEVETPPTTEQAKIVEILSTVDQAIDQTEALIAKQQRIKTGLMQDLLTRGIDENGNLRSEETHEFKDSPLGRIPVEWDDYQFGQCVDLAVDGPFGSNLKTEHYVTEPGVRVLRLQNIGNGEFVDTDKAWISEAHAKKLARHAVEASDLLIGSLGDDRRLFGRACLYPDSPQPAIVKADVFRVRCKNDMLAHGFAFRLFNLPRWRSGLVGLAQGVTRDRVNLSNLMLLRLPVPRSVDEQRAIASKLDGVDAVIVALHTNHEKLKATKTALMQDLLTGKVSVAPLLTDAEGGA